jgi:hypothetical protein
MGYYRLPAILITVLFAICANANIDSKEIDNLFDKYESFLAGKKIKPEEIFSPKYLSTLPKSLEKKKNEEIKYKILIKAGSTDQKLIFVKRIPLAKGLLPESFALIKINEKWLIEGKMKDDI